MKTSSNTARSIRTAGFALLIAAVSAVQACSSETTLTEPLSVSRGPTTPPSQIRVSGTVTDDDGAPVAGVTVSFYRMSSNGRAGSAVSDDKGFYSASVSSGFDVLALTTKEGFASAWHNHSVGAADFQWNLSIYRTTKTGG
jgi:hypothetical protein